MDPQHRVGKSLVKVQERSLRRKQPCWALILNPHPRELLGINASCLTPSFGILLLFLERWPEWSSHAGQQSTLPLGWTHYPKFSCIKLWSLRKHWDFYNMAGDRPRLFPEVLNPCGPGSTMAIWLSSLHYWKAIQPLVQLF